MDESKTKGEKKILKKTTSINYRSYSNGSSVTVHTTNLSQPERERLNSILSEYKEGRFNSMEDIDEVSRSLRAKYVFLENGFSSDVVESVKKTLGEKYQVIHQATYLKFFQCHYEYQRFQENF